MSGISGEQFNWKPPGKANPISVSFIHMLHAEDFHIQTVLQGLPRIWESGDWKDEIGLDVPPGQGQNWEVARGREFDLAVVMRYQIPVRAATKEYLSNLSIERLGDQVDFYTSGRSVAQVLDGLVIHLAGHAGEIAALKGIQGIYGLPF